VIFINTEKLELFSIRWDSCAILTQTLAVAVRL